MVVLDSGSSDRTVSIAASFANVRVLQHAFASFECGSAASRQRLEERA